MPLRVFKRQRASEKAARAEGGLMSGWLTAACGICGASCRGIQDFNTDALLVECERCSIYVMTMAAMSNCKTMDITLRPFLSCATRQAFELKRRFVLTGDNLETVAREHANSGIPENVEKLLAFFRNRHPRPGKSLTIELDRDFPVTDVQDAEEFKYVIECAEEQSLIRRGREADLVYQMTPKGWAYLMGPSGGGAVPRRCFVAMSFSLDAKVYADGMLPAIKEAGYTPVLMKDVLDNEDVCHRMLVEIRKAEIVVADFTELKSGVYFEAGFARALGREVFWTCREDFIRSVHFDTNHYQHIAWAKPIDLRTQLLEKILAISGPGPYGNRPTKHP